MKTLNYLLALCILFLSLSSYLFAQNSCLECHGDKDFSVTTDSGEELSLFVDETVFKKSIHGELECTDCHTDATGDPHPEKLAKVDCGICHEDETSEYGEGVHGKRYLQGDESAPTCASCHGKHDILSTDNPESRTYPINLPNTCGQCHKSDGVVSERDIDVSKPYERFEKGVHGHALMEGNEAAASCNSCHGSHLLLPKSDPRSLIYRTNISHTCGKCHDDIATEYDKSIHGQALARGEFDAPTCITCHGEHEIQSPTEPTSPTNPEHIAEETCSPCHGLPKLNQKYGLLPNPVESYQHSYHGLASSRGSKIAANCTSCHGIHNILPQSDPNSTIHPANLTKTCGNCHPNATESFARSYIHASPLSLEDRISSIIKSIYIYLIIIVIGGMIVHNFIIWFSYVRAKYNALKVQSTIRRFDRHWVIQHIATFVSFTLLVITGFALKFPDATWAQLLTRIGLTEHVRGIVHRASAVVLIAAAAYQWLFLLFARSWRGELKSLLPTITDIHEFFLNMRYYLGITRTRPDFDRYSYVEKAEFWALVWGNLIMALTGIVLWFPTHATFLFPSWIIKVSETIHYYEAWLATLAILFYHMFFAIFHPEDYPINLTGLTGLMPEEEAKERFPRWYRRITGKTTEEKKDRKWEIDKGKFGI